MEHFDRQRDRVRWARRSPKDAVVLSVSQDGEAWLWPLHPEEPGDLVELARVRATRSLSDRERETFGLHES